MQNHGPEKVEYIGHVIKPGDFCPVQNNWKLRTGKSQTSVSSRQLETWKKLAPTGKIRFEWSPYSEFQVGHSGLFLELRPEDHWHHDSTLFFFRLPSCLESTINPENARLWWEIWMTKFAHEGPPRHLAVQVSTAQQGESKKCIVCCCINDVICQGDMHTVAKKVKLSVCCVVSC
jgi:hypothetical protein